MPRCQASFNFISFPDRTGAIASIQGSHLSSADCCLLRCTFLRLVRFGNDVDAAAVLVEHHDTVSQCKKCVISALTDIATGSPFSAALPSENVASDDALTAEFFDAPPLAVRIATVAAGTLTFFMCHERTLSNQLGVYGVGERKPESTNLPGLCTKTRQPQGTRPRFSRKPYANAYRLIVWGQSRKNTSILAVHPEVIKASQETDSLPLFFPVLGHKVDVEGALAAIEGDVESPLFPRYSRRHCG